VSWTISINLAGTDPVHGHYMVITTAFGSCAQSIKPDRRTGRYSAVDTGEAGGSLGGTNPWPPYGGFVAAVDTGYHGPGTYTGRDLTWGVNAPRHASHRYHGSGGRLVVRANGSGTLTLTDAASNARGLESGTISWTCIRV
jgi:hypothetical protein